LIGYSRWWDNLDMLRDPVNCDWFLKLGDSLGELEVTIGPKARPVIAEVRAKLAAAVTMRDHGDMPGALAGIRSAMERLASLAGALDPGEGAIMRLMAERFSAALNFGDKHTAKDTVNFMRHKAGDPKDEPNTDW
jgi:hypothetical protein